MSSFFIIGRHVPNTSGMNDQAHILQAENEEDADRKVAATQTNEDDNTLVGFDPMEWSRITTGFDTEQEAHDEAVLMGFGIVVGSNLWEASQP